MQYKLGTPDPMTPSIESDFIKSLSSGLNWIDDADKIIFIPKDDSNTSYQEYLEWVAEGNTPEPADEE